MAGHADIYRALVRLYPKEFRRHYGNDLLQNFVDLLGRDGAARTWPRVMVDLVLTVPRYRLETVMNQRQSTAALGGNLGWNGTSVSYPRRIVPHLVHRGGTAAASSRGLEGRGAY